MREQTGRDAPVDDAKTGSSLSSRQSKILVAAVLVTTILAAVATLAYGYWSFVQFDMSGF